MTASFSVTGGITSNTRKFKTMSEHKQKGIFSLNINKLGNHVDDLKIILILHNEMLLLMLFCNSVLKEREDIPR